MWTKLYNTTVLEYNPIWNYERTEEITDTETQHSTTGSNHTSETKGSTKNSGTDTQKEYVTGFNSSSPTLAKQIEQGLGTGNSVSGTIDATDSETNDGTINKSHTARHYGNIGVMSTQQMIEQERKVAEFNVISYIIDSFKTRFCLLVY